MCGPLCEIWYLVGLCMDWYFLIWEDVESVDGDEESMKESPLTLVVSPCRLHGVSRSSSFHMHLVVCRPCFGNIGGCTRRYATGDTSEAIISSCLTMKILMPCLMSTWHVTADGEGESLSLSLRRIAEVHDGGEDECELREEFWAYRFGPNTIYVNEQSNAMV